MVGSTSSRDAPNRRSGASEGSAGTVTKRGHDIRSTDPCGRDNCHGMADPVRVVASAEPPIPALRTSVPGRFARTPSERSRVRMPAAAAATDRRIARKATRPLGRTE
jgi:hypothetical protein